MDFMSCNSLKPCTPPHRSFVSFFKFLNFIKVIFVPVFSKKLVYSPFASCMGRVTKSKLLFENSRLFLFLYSYVLIFDTSFSLLLNEESEFSFCLFFFLTRAVLCFCDFLLLFSFYCHPCDFSRRAVFSIPSVCVQFSCNECNIFPPYSF